MGFYKHSQIFSARFRVKYSPRTFFKTLYSSVHLKLIWKFTQNRENIGNNLTKNNKTTTTKNVIARILCKRCLESVLKVYYTRNNKNMNHNNLENNNTTITR